MTKGALAFMVISWALVLGTTAWVFVRVLRSQSRKS